MAKSVPVFDGAPNAIGKMNEFRKVTTTCSIGTYCAARTEDCIIVSVPPPIFVEAKPIVASIELYVKNNVFIDEDAPIIIIIKSSAWMGDSNKNRVHN